MARTAVGVRELKTRLGRYLREVRGGRTIVITDRGDPVAELRPIPQAAGAEAEIDRLVALGRVSRVAKGPLAPFRPIRRKGLSLSDAIREGREDRF